MEKRLKAVYFVEDAGAEDPGHGAAVAAEMDRAVQALRAAGFRSRILYFPKETLDRTGTPNKNGSSDQFQRDLRDHYLPCADSREFDLPCTDPREFDFEETLFLCDRAELLRRLRAEGCYAAGYSHAENAGESFSGALYVLQEPDLVDRDSYCKIYEREAGLPWTILETQRCLVREFTAEDLDGIYGLYDELARRFLEPPSADRAHEASILRAYIDRIYRLYGFGHWAVLEKPAGRLIGRIGFAAVTAQQEREALELGVRGPGGAAGNNGQAWSGIDADFGFLVAASHRGKGIAEEVCRALLRYGFESLGFEKVRADARIDNRASIRLLQKLGFEQAGTVPGDDGSRGMQRVVFLRTTTNGI